MTTLSLNPPHRIAADPADVMCVSALVTARGDNLIDVYRLHGRTYVVCEPFTGPLDPPPVELDVLRYNGERLQLVGVEHERTGPYWMDETALSDHLPSEPNYPVCSICRRQHKSDARHSSE